MREQAEGYVRAIQWTLNYYYNGVCSWSWFYPHHYAPYVSDVKEFSDFKIEFDLGSPFKPYEQLLGVLPAASKNLLPQAYHHLMTDDSSIIKEYYPEEFQTDLNGKRQDWEAVVLVPFIDENVLLEAMKPCNDKLNDEEQLRNCYGPMSVYAYEEQQLGIYESPNYFPQVLYNHASCVAIEIKDISVPREKLVKGAYPGASFDVFYPGFPTMKHIKFTAQLVNAKVKVFEMCSRSKNMILKILPNELYFGDSIPEDLLGKIVWVGWPHLVEAKVVGISNKRKKYVWSRNDNSKEMEETSSSSLFDKAAEGVTQYYKERMGVEFGTIEVLVHVNLLVGHKYVFASNTKLKLEKQFSSIVSYFPLQSIVSDIKVHEEYYSSYNDVADLFPVDSLCFSLTNPFYGSQGRILDSKESLKHDQLTVSLTVVNEPDFCSACKINDKVNNSYFTLAESASQVAISNYVFSRITGSLFLVPKNVENSQKSTNFGLNLKFNKKNLETPGYTAKIDGAWCYTTKAVDLVNQFRNSYPEIFHYLSYSNDSDLNADEIFGSEDSDEKVKDVQNWLKSLPIHNIERRACQSSVLESEVVKEIERIIDETTESSRYITMKIKPQHLFKPGLQIGNLAPDMLTETKVFDRVVNVRDGFTVPLGLKGTVTAVHKITNSVDNNDEMYEIVFDKVFPGGMTLNCTKHRGYSLQKTSFINLSYGKRHMEQKTGVSGTLRALAKERQNTNSLYVNSRNSHVRPQNSAFASFSATANKVDNQFQQPNASGGSQSTVDKNSFRYLTNFSEGYGSRINKENSFQQKNQVKPTVPTSKGFTQVLQRPPSLDEKNNADALRRVLKIGNNSHSDVRPKPKESVPVHSTRNHTSGFGNRDTAAIVSASARLLSYYQSSGLGCPRYTYLESGNGVSAQVVLPSGKVICGKNGRSREDASENVAADALNMLDNVPAAAPKFPLHFPVPPTNWVQQRPQVFGNRFYQAKQGGYRPPGNVMDYKRNPGQNQQNSRNFVPTNAANFVPLQALKNQRTPMKGGYNPHKGSNVTQPQNRFVSRRKTDVSNSAFGEGLQESNVPVEVSEKPARHRKIRIAANFHQ